MEQKTRKNLKIDFIFWTFIFPIGTILRLFRLGHFSLWYDECASIQLTTLVDRHLSFFSPSLNNEPPANIILTFLWLKFLDLIRFWEKFSEWDDFAIRLLPCFWGILSILLFYKITKKVFNNSVATLVATFIFAISPFQIYYAQELRIYSFYVFLNLIGFLCILNILEKNSTKYWVGLGFVFVILLYSHFFSGWIILITNLFLLLVIILELNWDMFKKWFWTNFIAFILVLPSLYIFWHFYISLTKIKYQWYPHPTLKTSFITWKNLFAGYTDRVEVYWIVFIISVLLFLYGVWCLREKKYYALYIIFMAILPIWGNVVYWALKHHSFYEHRHFIFSGVVATFAVGYGLASIGNRPLRYGMTAIFIGCTFICLFDYYNGRLHPVDTHRLGVYQKIDFRNLARYIKTNFKEGDLVGHYGYSLSPTIRYYFQGFPNSGLAPSEFDIQAVIDAYGTPTLLARHGLLPTVIEEATKNYKRVWFVESTGTTFEYKPRTELVKEWLNHHGTIIEVKDFEGLRVTLYELNRKDPEIK